MAISVHILKLVENDPFLRLQMAAKEMCFLKKNSKFWKFFTSQPPEKVRIGKESLLAQYGMKT